MSINNKNIISVLFYISILSVNFLVSNDRFLRQIFFRIDPYQVEYNYANVNYALKLKEITTTDATVGVVWAGAVPYYSERDGIDFLGKSDRYIATLNPKLDWSNAEFGMKTFPGHNKYDLKYSILQLKPDIIERPDWSDQSVGLDTNYNYVIKSYKGIQFIVRADSVKVKIL